MMFFVCMTGLIYHDSYAASSKTKKPAKPTVKTCKVLDKNKVRISWKKAKNAKKYKVQYKLKSASSYKTAKTFKAGKKSYTFTIKGLKYGKSYKVRILAVNGKNKAASKAKTVTTGKKSADNSSKGNSEKESSGNKTDPGSSSGDSGSGSQGGQREHGETEMDPL